MFFELNIFVSLKNNSPAVRKTDYKKIFPFDEESFNSKTKSRYIKKSCFLSLLNDKIKNITKRIEDSAAWRLPFRYRMCEVVGFVSKILGVYYFPELKSVMQKNGHLTIVDKKSANPNFAINRITDFSKWLQKDNNAIPLVYFQYPCKISKYDKNLPSGISDIKNDISDKLLYGLKKNNVYCLDLRELIEKESLDYSTLFLKNDHHWKTETGLWVTNESCKYLNKEIFNNTLNNNNLNSKLYNFFVIKNYSLGSIGRKLTLGYVELDNLTLVFPKFETKLELNFYDGQTQGSFYDVFIDNEAIKNNEEIYEKIRYHFFKSYGGFYHVRNKMINNNYKILFIADSYNAMIIPFLSCIFHDVYYLSPRDFNGSIKTVCKKLKPNIVTIGYTARCIPEPDDYEDFNYPLYCFD